MTSDQSTERCLKTERIETLEEVIFGNPRTGEMGMKAKVDEIHTLLIQAKGLGGFIGGLRGGLTTLIVLTAAIAWFKGWIK